MINRLETIQSEVLDSKTPPQAHTSANGVSKRERDRLEYERFKGQLSFKLMEHSIPFLVLITTLAVGVAILDSKQVPETQNQQAPITEIYPTR